MPNYVTVKQLSEMFPAFSESSLRYHLFHRDNNNLSKHIRQIGKKILIDAHGFANEWIDSNGGKS